MASKSVQARLTMSVSADWLCNARRGERSSYKRNSSLNSSSALRVMEVVAHSTSASSASDAACANGRWRIVMHEGVVLRR